MSKLYKLHYPYFEELACKKGYANVTRLCRAYNVGIVTRYGTGQWCGEQKLNRMIKIWDADPKKMVEKVEYRAGDQLIRQVQYIPEKKKPSPEVVETANMKKFVPTSHVITEDERNQLISDLVGCVSSLQKVIGKLMEID